MGKKVENTLDNELQNKKDLFIKNIDSDMHFVSNYLGNSIKFDWVDESPPLEDLPLFNREDRKFDFSWEVENVSSFLSTSLLNITVSEWSAKVLQKLKRMDNKII